MANPSQKDYGEIERATRDDLSVRYIAHDITLEFLLLYDNFEC